MNLRTAICPRLARKARKIIASFPRAAWECWVGRAASCFEILCISVIVPTLRRGNAGVDAPASRNLCGANVFGDESVFRNAGALRTEFPRRSVGTMHIFRAKRVFRGQEQCRSGFFIVPTLRRGNAGVDAPASRNLCGANVFGDESVFRNAGALRTEFPRRSVGTMHIFRAKRVFRGQEQCRSGFFIVPTLRRGNAGVDAPASRNLCEANVFGDESVFRNAGALRTEFPRRSVGTMPNFSC